MVAWSAPGIGGHDDRPLPALIAGQLGQEAVGGRRRVLEADAEVLTDRVVAAELDDRRAGLLDGTRQHRGEIASERLGARRQPLRLFGGFRSRCPSPPILPDTPRGQPHRSPARPPSPAWGRIDVVTGPRRDHRDPAAHGPLLPAAPACRRTPRHGQLPQRRDADRRPARHRTDAERQPVAAAAGRATRRRDGSRARPTRPGRGRRRRRAGHRHPGRRAAQPRDGLEDVRPGAPGGHRRRRRQVRTDRADLAGGGQLRGRRRDGGRAGQHVVLRGRHRREQEQGRAVPAHHHRAVRGDRAADRPRARPAAARPARRAGHLVRAAHRAGRWC